MAQKKKVLGADIPEKEENPLPHVSCKKMWYSRTANPTHTVVVLDIGVKTSFVKKLNEYGLNVIVVPFVLNCT